MPSLDDKGGAGVSTLQPDGSKAETQSLADKLGMAAQPASSDALNSDQSAAASSNPVFNTLFGGSRPGVGEEMKGGTLLSSGGANLHAAQKFSSGYVPISATALGAGSRIGGLH